MCNNTGTKRFRTIEVAAAAGKNEYALISEDILNGAKRITAFEVYRVGTVGLTPGNQVVVNDTIFNKSYLTISTAGADELLNKIPFTSLERKANNGEVFMVDIPPIAASKCKVFIPSTAGLVAGEAWLIGVHYE